MDKIYFGKTLLCRTNYRDNQIHGRISFTREAIGVKLVGFENFVHFRDGESIPLYLEDNQYCTVASFSTSPGSLNSGNGTCHFLKFSAKRAIIGFRPWNDDDRVAEFYFGLSDTNRLLEAPDIIRKIRSSKIGDQPDNKIISASAGGATVTICYSYSMDWHDDNYSASEPYGHVIFNEPKSLRELSQFVAILRTFLTMAAGIAVRTIDYRIVPHDNQEQLLLDGGTAPASFQLIWPSGNVEEDKGSDWTRPTSVLRCFDEVGRKSTSDCLKFWMENWDTWSPAFSGLYLATRQGNNFDTNRIINACKWLESTPGAQQIKLGNEQDLKKISDAAIEKAQELGLDISGRISGAIQRLGTESRNNLFQRLIDQAVREDKNDLKERLCKDLHTAFRIRGVFAHSRFDHTSDDDFGDYVRCTQAVETLAFLLLYRSLPLPEDHFWGHGPNKFTDYLYY